jgi:hypothetical protein
MSFFASSSIHAHSHRPPCWLALPMTRIEVMNSLDLTRNSTSLEQVYLIERDAGLLCRILGLYAGRGVDVLHVDYAYAARDVMKLQVSVASGFAGIEEVVRVLVDKASTFIGVLAASEQREAERRSA